MLTPEQGLVCRKLRSFPPAVWRDWLQLPSTHAAAPDHARDTAELLARLTGHGLLLEAARLLAYALPEREAVWWSCMCVRHTLDVRNGLEEGAIAAAEAWVRAPDVRARRVAGAAATSAGFETPGAWSAIGAAWSHRMRQRPDLCGGRGAAKAVEMSAARGNGERTGDVMGPVRLQRFIQSGIDIGNGGAGRLPGGDELCR